MPLANSLRTKGSKQMKVFPSPLHQYENLLTSTRQQFDQKLKNALVLIETAAKEYFYRTGKIPILVIDNIDYLATAEPDDLGTIQNRAKMWADNAILMVIFVSSDGAAPPQLRSRSTYSRAYVGGIPQSTALKYLVECKKFDVEVAREVVEKLTGDRLYLIMEVAKSSGVYYEAIQSRIFSRMESYILPIYTKKVAC